MVWMVLKLASGKRAENECKDFRAQFTNLLIQETIMA